MMYGVEFETNPQIMDKEFIIPIGKAKIEREGKDITITAHAKMVGHSQLSGLVRKRAKKELEIDKQKLRKRIQDQEKKEAKLEDDKLTHS